MNIEGYLYINEQKKEILQLYVIQVFGISIRKGYQC